LTRLSTLSAPSFPDRSIAEQCIDLAVVLPTYKEQENIGEVIAKLAGALKGLNWELIFVDDDSPDGTAEIVRAYARCDRRIRLLHRVGRRGLSSACIEGIMATTANYVAVMDADMQHDETLLPKMLTLMRQDSLDVVVGTRNSLDGSMGQFSPSRVLLSKVGKNISHSICRCKLSDPMSGFFLVNQAFFLKIVHRLQGNGFKILVDMLASSMQPVRIGEIGYCFRNRKHGESKLDVNTAVEYVFLVVNKLMGGIVPSRFAIFALVGSTGVAMHLACLALFFFGLHMHFFAAQATASFVAMTENFFLNNLITYRDRSLRGVNLLSGVVSFWLACSFGAWANVVFARALFQSGWSWYFAGLSGIILSSVWNYSISNLFTWQMPTQHPEVSEDNQVSTLSHDLGLFH